MKVVYDITDRRSFDNVKSYWLNEVRKHAPTNAVVMLVGNKCDMVEQRTVPFVVAEKFASENGISLFEVSAKSGINVEDAFIELASSMRERILLSKMGVGHCDSTDEDEISSGFHIDGIERKPPKYVQGNCCFSQKINGTFV